MQQNKLINELLNKSIGKSVVVDEKAEDTFLAAFQSIAKFEGKSETKTRTSFTT